MKTLLPFLGLMRRAGALSITAEQAEKDIRSHRACLVLLADDCSARTAKDVRFAASVHGVEVISVPFTKQELAAALGSGSCSVLSINDRGFADSFKEKYGFRSA